MLFPLDLLLLLTGLSPECSQPWQLMMGNASQKLYQRSGNQSMVGPMSPAVCYLGALVCVLVLQGYKDEPFCCCVVL